MSATAQSTEAESVMLSHVCLLMALGFASYSRGRAGKNLLSHSKQN